MRKFALIVMTICCSLWTFQLPAMADENCQLQKFSSISMGTDIRGQVYVPILIGGQRVNLLVNGGSFSALTDSATNELKLTQRLITSTIAHIALGGVPLTHYVVAEDVTFGDLHTPRMDFLVVPNGGYSSEIGGFLGEDILQNYDVELDFATETLNLFSPHQCKHQVVYWTIQPFAEVPFNRSLSGLFSMPTTLDNKQINAELALASTHSYLSLEAAKNLFGWGAGNPDIIPLGDSSTNYRYPFKSLTFDGVTVSNPEIILGPGKASLSGTPLIIGLDILRQLHIYIAYKEKNIYFTAASSH